VDITSGEQEVKGPCLIVTITDSKFESWKHIALNPSLVMAPTRQDPAAERSELPQLAG
jgi:hypothetical protein